MIIFFVVKGNKIRFITDHFSNYGIIGKKIVKETDPDGGRPATGDNSPILPITLLAVVSLSTIAVLIKKRKKVK